MRSGWWKRFAVPGAALLALAACGPSAPPETNEPPHDYTLYLVRHAEKTSAASDPELSDAGLERADLLVSVLEDKGVEAIWSTDYRRTQATAAPLAEHLEIDVRLYDPSDLDAFAEKLQALGETALVVGHSNTTPELAGALGGDGGEPIVEATEYDRLYVITGLAAGTVVTDIQRFGARHDGGSE